MRYFSHIQDREMLIADPEGDELPDDAAALSHAQETMQEIKDRWDLYDPENWRRRALVVVDETGRLVATVTYPVPKNLH